MELGVATLGIAIAKVLLRLDGYADVADSINDILGQRGRGGKSKAHENIEELLGAVIAQRLKDRLPRGMKLESTDFLAAAEDVRLLMLTLLNDGEAMLVAIRRGEDFKRWVLANSGRKLRARTSSSAEPIFDSVLDAACVEFVQFAPRSPLLLSAGLREVLDKADHIPGLVDQVAQIPQKSADLTLAAIDDREARLRTSLPNWVVNASVTATKANRIVGPKVSEWSAAALGVHAPIDQSGPDSLTGYIRRSHDQQLSDLVKDVVELDGNSLFLLAVGTSCAGKTRAMYECLNDLLPDWQLIAPTTAHDLRDALAAGVPARTVIWWDELQLRVSRSEAIGIAPALSRLLQADDELEGPVLLAATVWRANLLAMQSRSAPDDAANGADSLPQLLELAVKVPIVDHFSELERDCALQSSDARVRAAAETATFSSKGWQVTQTLAGGATLLSRIAEDDPSQAHFSPSARALLRASADLRRVGLKNPLPGWAIEGSASGYLDDPRPTGAWLPEALAECTKDAAGDDSILGTQNLDFRRTGVPALRVHWVETGPKSAVRQYELHDILLHDRMSSLEPAPIPASVWECLSDHREALTYEERQRISEFARNRAMFSLAQTFQPDPLERLGILAESGDPNALAELAALAEHELTKFGQWGATVELARALRNSRNVRAVGGSFISVQRFELAIGVKFSDLLFSVAETDEYARAQLEVVADGSLYMSARLAALRPGWVRSFGWRTDLVQQAERGNWYAKAELRDELAIEEGGDALSDLRERCEAGSTDARRRLTKVLARRSAVDIEAENEILEWARTGDEVAREELLAAWSAKSRGISREGVLLDNLREAVFLGWSNAANVLIARYRSSNANVRELDPTALPL